MKKIKHIVSGLLMMILAQHIVLGNAMSISFDSNSVEQKIETVAQIDQLITELIQSVYQSENYQFEISPKRIPAQLEAKGVRILKVRPSVPGLPKGYTLFDVDYEVNGYKRVAKIQYMVTVLQHLPVPLNRIEGGSSLSTDIFTHQWVDITNLRGSIIEDVSLVDGMVAAGLLRSGYPIRPTDLVNPPIIKAGDQVKMVYSNGGIQLAISVVSRVSAPKGEIINVWCEDTRKTYKVKVLSKTSVQWEQTL